MQNNSKQIIGIAWMLCHCLLISIMSAMIRELSAKFHIFEIVFFHNIVAFVLILPFVCKSSNIKTRKLPLHLLRGALGVISLAMYFYALTIIPLTQARAIALSGPLISSLLAILFLKEKTNWHKSLALMIGLAGSLLILRPGESDFSYATLLVVVAVCIWSLIDIIIKILSSESTATQFLYLTATMSLLSIPGAVYFWRTPENYTEWLWLISIGIVFLLNIMAIFNAFKYADVTTIMPFDFTGMIFTAIIAYFCFDEVIKSEVLIGGLIILISSVYIIRQELVRQKGDVIPENVIQE